MRRALTWLPLFFTVLAGAGCSGPSEAFTTGVESALGAIEPEYRAYVEADPALTQEEKAIRFRTLSMLQALLDEAKAFHEEPKP